MPTQIYRYTKVVEPGPNGYTIYARLQQAGTQPEMAAATTSAREIQVLRPENCIAIPS